MLIFLCLDILLIIDFSRPVTAFVPLKSKVLTQSGNSADESHGNREIDVPSQQDAPKVGPSPAGAGAQNKQAEAEQSVRGQDPSNGVRKL